MFQYREDDENEASHAKDSKESSTSESQERTNLLRWKRQKGGSKVKKRRSKRLMGSSQEISLIGGSTVKQRRGKSIIPSHLSSTKFPHISKFQLKKQRKYPIKNAKVDRRDRLASRRSDQSFLGRSTQNAASDDIAQHNHAQSTNNAEYESAAAEEEEDNEHILPPIHISKFQLKKQRRSPIRNAKVDRRDRLASRRSDQNSLLPEANTKNDVNRSTSFKHQLLKRPSLNVEQDNAISTNRSKRVDDNNLIQGLSMQSAASGDIGDSNNTNTRSKRSLVGHDTNTNCTKKRPKKGGVATAKKLVVQIDAAKKIQMYWKEARRRSVEEKSDKEASLSAKSRDMESNILDVYEKEGTSRILTKRKNWTAQEDDALCSAVKKNNGDIPLAKCSRFLDWKMIAKEVPSRTFLQCRSRWNNVLKYRDGGEAKGQSKWSSEEDSIIVRLHREKGNRWKDISDALNGKTPIEVRSHFIRHLQGSKRTNEQKQSRLQKQSLPQGFTRKIDLPKELRKALSLVIIKKWNGAQWTVESKNWEKMWEFIFSILKVFVFPRAPVELRSKTVWKLRAMRYLNYFSALIILIRYQGHDELPEELRCDGIPPWWYVVRFFNHFKLPREYRESNDNSLYDNSLGVQIHREFHYLHGDFITWIAWIFEFSVKDKFKDDYLDCSLDTNPKELYADLQIFIDNYNKQYNVGAYDETWFNKDTKKCKDEKRHDELMEIASSGLHHFEIALMETAFQAKPLTQDEKYKQFAALKIDSIKVYEKLEMTEKEIKEKDSIIDAQNIEIEILKQQLAKKNEKNKRVQEMESLSKDLQEDLQCPICFNPMKDPCIVPECCHRFCYACINDAIAKCGKECPVCRARITSRRDLRRDELFGKIAEVVCRHDGEDQSEKN